MVGIKSFQFKNGAQKIAQFKQQNKEWTNKTYKIVEAKNIKENYASLFEEWLWITIFMLAFLLSL